MQKYQVAELTDLLKKTIERSFPGNIMVTGEVAESFKSAGGHYYFSLKDEGNRLKAVLFRNAVRRDSFIPKNGDKVNAIGELQLYPPDGTYQLMVRKVEYTEEGDLWKRFEETKKRLEAEGLFDPATKRAIPPYPKRIALLTAATGAAVRDFIVTARNAGGLFHIDLWTIPVQGRDYAPKIAQVINQAGRRDDLYDLLVLTRGGGSPEDLAVFNEEVVARALKGAKIPTISAIGHEQDITICDFVADLRVATPTAAAERISVKFKQTAVNIGFWHSRIFSLLRWRIEHANLSLDKLSTKVLAFGPANFLQRERFRFQAANAKLRQQIRVFTTERRHKLDLLTRGLEMNNPDRLLELGYASISTKDGEVVSSIAQVALDTELNIKMKDGIINTFVTGKKSRR
ncbi:MAG: exodeoxyribonuclease VII large subunit [Deferribacteraceae bacterium]|jgi:exodeoxyribonuclease VII large subunit|nr:exodeoxyribonuclease VII large subunit [Deferribacteraceae bacterium]